MSWELRGKYPEIFNDPVVGKEAKKLFEDAQELIAQITEQNALTAKGVCGIHPANSTGDDDIQIYTDESRTKLRCTLNMLRQQAKRGQQLPNLCLADFIAPDTSGVADYIGAFVVTAGIGAEELCRKFEAEHDDYSAILVKAIADRLAEAAAEWLHERVRREWWGYAADEALTNTERIAEKYRGIRPAPGYPACPDHTEKEKLFSLLNATEHTSVLLTENYAMFPAASVSGWYFSHPASSYFSIGKISADQLADYAHRKQWSADEASRWLAPLLD